MRKIFAFVLTVCLCMGIMIPVQASSPMTVSGESVSAAPGEKFAIDLSVSGNSGFAYLKIRLDYDPSVFTFHAEEAVSATASLVLAAGEYLVSWDSSVNYSENEKIGVLYFTASEAAAEGNYSIGISVEECYDINTDDVVTTTVNSAVEIKKAEVKSVITTANMRLGTDITVNYMAKLDASHVGAQMRFTMNGVEQIVDGTPTGNGNEYMFPFRGVSPQCMGDNIKAELILNGEVLDVQETYSVKEYCDNTLAKTASELGMSTEKHAALQTLLKDVLVYGAKAQLYRNYKTDSLVDESVTGTAFAELTSTDKYIEETSIDGVQIVSVGLYFDYTNSMYIRFTAPGMAEEDFKIVFDGDIDNAYTLDDCTAVEGQPDTYLLVLPSISLLDYDEIYSIEIGMFRANGRMIDGQYIEYSVASYIYTMQNKSADGALTPMAQLARATYNYGLAATAYATINE